MGSSTGVEIYLCFTDILSSPCLPRNLYTDICNSELFLYNGCHTCQSTRPLFKIDSPKSLSELIIILPTHLHEKSSRWTCLNKINQINFFKKSKNSKNNWKIITITSIINWICTLAILYVFFPLVNLWVFQTFTDLSIDLKETGNAWIDLVKNIFIVNIFFLFDRKPYFKFSLFKA